MRLHKTYGLNPTLSICITCGEETGEIVLLGGAYKEEAPMKMVTSIEPCKTCQEKFKGFVLLVCTDSNRNPLGPTAYIKESAFTQIFDKTLPPKGIAMIEQEAFTKLKELI
jgi:hypothetical protein